VSFVGFTRSGDTINASFVQSVNTRFREGILFERSVVFPDDFRQRFPRINFTSEPFTAAAKDALFLQPVLSYYKETVAQLVKQYQSPRLLALAMGSHGRLGKGNVALEGDALELVARQVLGKWC
jgi:hypothetical protein